MQIIIRGLADKLSQKDKITVPAVLGDKTLQEEILKMRKSLLKTVAATAIVGVTMALSSVAAWAKTYELNVGNLTAGDITENTSVGTDSFFTLLAKDGQKDSKYNQHMTIEEKSKSCEGITYTKQLKTNGTPDFTNEFRAIRFTVDKPSTVTIVASSGKSGKTRHVQLYSNDGKPIENAATAVGDSLSSGKISITEQGTYSIASSKTDSSTGSINIFYIKVETTAESAADITSESAPAGDRYAVDAAASYIIHTVTSDELAYASLAMAPTSGDAIAATKTTSVYSSVKFPDGSVITAPEGSYLYAVKVNKTTAPSAASYKWVNAG